MEVMGNKNIAPAPNGPAGRPHHQHTNNGLSAAPIIPFPPPSSDSRGIGEFLSPTFEPIGPLRPSETF